MNSVALKSFLLLCCLHATLVRGECNNQDSTTCQLKNDEVVLRDPQALCNALKTTGSHKSELDATCSSYVFCYSTTDGTWSGLNLACGDGFWYNTELGYCTDNKPTNCT